MRRVAVCCLHACISPIHAYGIRIIYNSFCIYGYFSRIWFVWKVHDEEQTQIDRNAPDFE